MSRGKNTQNHTDIANNTKRKKSANSQNIQKQTGKSFGAQKVALTGFEAPISNNDLKEIFKKNYAKQQNLNNIETDISDIDKANNINNDVQSKTNYIYVKSQQPIKDLYENTLNGIGHLFEPKKAKEKREQEAQQAHQEYLEQMGKIKDELKQIGIEYMKKQNPLYPLPPKGQWGKPTKNGSITSNYGNRFHPILKKIIFHEGIDIGVPIDTPVYAVAEGKVKEVKWAKGYGNYVEIEHKTSKGETITSYYGHLKNFSTKNGTRLKVGQTVNQGEQIALSGNTGASTGAHLHFGMKMDGKQQDPTKYMGEVYKKVK